MTSATKKVVAETSAEDSESDSDDDTTTKAVATKKAAVAAAAPVKKVVAKKEESDSSSSDDDSSEDEKPVPVVAKNQKAAKVVAKKEESDSDDSDDSSDEDEKPAAKKAVPAAKPAAAVTKKVEKKADSSDDDSSSSDDSDDDEEEKKPVVAAKRASADDEEDKPLTKKAKTVPDASPAAAAGSASATMGIHKIYVKGLPWVATEKEVRDFFKACGKISSVELPMGEDGRSSGTAFVIFAERSELDKALELDGQYWPGTERWLKIQEGFEKSDRKSFGTGVRPEGCDTVFVGNLPFDVEEEQLREVFASAGTVDRVRFAMAEDGSFKGFAHVQFTDGDATDEAVKLAGTDINGRAIRVDYAPPRNREGGAPASGGRGGRGDGGRGGGRGGGGRGGGGRGGRGAPAAGNANKGSIAVSTGKKIAFD